MALLHVEPIAYPVCFFPGLPDSALRLSFLLSANRGLFYALEVFWVLGSGLWEVTQQEQDCCPRGGRFRGREWEGQGKFRVPGFLLPSSIRFCRSALFSLSCVCRASALYAMQGVFHWRVLLRGWPRGGSGRTQVHGFCFFCLPGLLGTDMDLAKARSFPLALVFSPGVIVGSLSHCRFHPASLLQEREKKVPMNEISVLFLQQNNPRKCCDEGWASKPLPCNQGVCVVTIHLVHSQKRDFVHKFFA